MILFRTKIPSINLVFYGQSHLEIVLTESGKNLAEPVNALTMASSEQRHTYCSTPYHTKRPNERLAVRIKTKISIVCGPNLQAYPNYIELCHGYAVHTFPIASGVCPTMHIHFSIKLWILTSALEFIFRVRLQLTILITVSYFLFHVYCILLVNAVQLLYINTIWNIFLTQD